MIVGVMKGEKLNEMKTYFIYYESRKRVLNIKD
jgi:hypothetical protein